MRGGIRYHGHCIDCTERTLGCHSTCEYYKADKARHDAEKEQISRAAGKNAEWQRYLKGKRKRWK